MKATKVGEDSSIQRMIRLVQSADAGKAKIVELADRWATWIVVIALTAAGLTWLITGQIIRAVTILVVFCPCALVLATLTAIMAAIGNATKHGFLVREGDALERLANAKVIAFDKTGTLTYGTPEVVAAESVSVSFNKDEIYRLAASAEQFSEHPLGKAIVSCYKKTGKTLPEAKDFRMIPGRGVCAVVDGKTILAGNPELLHEQGVALGSVPSAEDYSQQGCTVTYVTLRFSQVLEKNGMRHIRFHDLRHTFASILINKDIPLFNVSKYLGHSDISTTANIYAHLDKSGKNISAETISALFDDRHHD